MYVINIKPGPSTIPIKVIIRALKIVCLLYQRIKGREYIPITIINIKTNKHLDKKSGAKGLRTVIISYGILNVANKVLNKNLKQPRISTKLQFHPITRAPMKTENRYIHVVKAKKLKFLIFYFAEAY